MNVVPIIFCCQAQFTVTKAHAFFVFCTHSYFVVFPLAVVEGPPGGVGEKGMRGDLGLPGSEGPDGGTGQAGPPGRKGDMGDEGMYMCSPTYAQFTALLVMARAMQHVHNVTSTLTLSP